jgi:iron complex outermembrane receptor protein
LWGKDFGTIENGLFAFDEISKYGKEKILSIFIQDKHYFLPQLILNAGARYDLKYRQEEDVVRTFSPRLALMYVPHERFSLKLSYSEAFADLSFYNRYLTKTEFFSMKPQHLSALQLTAMGTVSPLHLNYEANIFYNKYTNLLCWQERDEYFGKNIGQLTNIGIESTIRYAHKRLSANLSLYYCHDISSEHYYYNPSENMVCNVPHFTLNLHGALKLIQGKTHELKVYGDSKYIGRKLNFQMEKEKDFFVDGVMLFDLGIKYMYKQRQQFSFDCENILNTDFYICGPNYQYAPKFQRGRSLMASLSYQF